MVTNADKKEFIEHFVDNYNFDNIFCKYILQHISRRTDVLERAKFVNKASDYNLALHFSTSCSQQEPFIFHMNDEVSNDIFKASEHIIYNSNNVFYIQLDFKGKELNDRYMNLLEDDDIKSKYDNEMNNFLDKTLLLGRVRMLKKQIDQALDERNEEMFYKLSSEINKLI